MPSPLPRPRSPGRLLPSCLLLLAAACSSTDPATRSYPDPRFPDLAAELLAMAVADQDARGALLVVPRDERGDYGPEGERVIDLIERLDRQHAERMEAIVDEHGWPGRSLVGEEPSHAAWLLVQHANRRPDLQARCLVLMREAVSNGEADQSDLAYLEDRVRVAQGQRQIFGTQLEPDGVGGWRPLPIDDPDGVDRRRAEVGLPPLADYIEIVRQIQSE